MGWMFQQKGALPHTAKSSLEWLEEGLDVNVGYCADSPDLSPIQLFWNILKKIVGRMRLVGIDDVKHTLDTAWSPIPQSCIGRLCEGFAARPELCLASEGLSISNQLLKA
jgi:hypothetical protein